MSAKTKTWHATEDAIISEIASETAFGTQTAIMQETWAAITAAIRAATSYATEDALTDITQALAEDE